MFLTSDTGERMAYAASWWSRETFDRYMSDSAEPMWNNLRSQNVELYREVRRVYMGDNPELEDYNVPERVEAFVRAASAYAKAYKGSAANGTLDVMFTIGSDFWYAGGGHIFTNMDKIIEHVNADGRVEALYSTPSQYVAAKAASGITFPLKTHDFFPYSDAPYAYWTGYFTSRPALKAYVRAPTGNKRAEGTVLLGVLGEYLTWFRRQRMSGMSDQLGAGFGLGRPRRLLGEAPA